MNKLTKVTIGLLVLLGLLIGVSPTSTKIKPGMLNKQTKTTYYEMSLEKIIDESGLKVYRLKVPDGWIVVFKSFGAGGTTFYPDPTHKWKGVK